MCQATTTGFIIASGFMIHYGLGRNVVWVIEASEMESFVKVGQIKNISTERC